MGKEACEICGQKSEFWYMQQHRLVPKELAKKAGVSKSAALGLCSKCLAELYAWYSEKVYDISYDPKTKRFERRPPHEMVNEYEAAYRSFIEYKKRQRKTPNSS